MPHLWMPFSLLLLASAPFELHLLVFAWGFMANATAMTGLKSKAKDSIKKNKSLVHKTSLLIRGGRALVLSNKLP